MTAMNSGRRFFYGDEKVRDLLALSGIGLLSLTLLLILGFFLTGRQTQVQVDYPLSALPALNAFLNGTSAVLLAVGYVFIRQKKVATHRACMLSAFGVSSLFLISYLVYHSQVGPTPFGGRGWVRSVYFPLLISHITLAAVILPFVLTTIYRAWSEQFDKHKRIARWTLPIWLYVSVTGVIVYLMLHQLFPPS